MERMMSQMAQDCLDLIKEMLSGEMTTEEKYIGMRELHKKYPDAGLNMGAENFAQKWLKQKERLPYKDDDDGDYPF